MHVSTGRHCDDRVVQGSSYVRGAIAGRIGVPMVMITVVSARDSASYDLTSTAVHCSIARRVGLAMKMLPRLPRIGIQQPDSLTSTEWAIPTTSSWSVGRLVGVVASIHWDETPLLSMAKA